MSDSQNPNDQSITSSNMASSPSTPSPGVTSSNMASSPNINPIKQLIKFVSAIFNPATSKLWKFIRTILICLTFDIVLGSCTIIWNYLALFTKTQNIAWFSLIGHGELLIISVAITAGAISTLLSSGKVSKDKTGSLFFFCVGFINIIITAGWFTSLSSNSPIVNKDGFEKMSLFLYAVSIAVSINCRLIAEV